MKPAPTDELGFPVQADPWEAPKPDREPWPRSLKLYVAAVVLSIAATGANVYTTTRWRRTAEAWQRRAFEAEREAAWLRTAFTARAEGRGDEAAFGACVFDLPAAEGRWAWKILRSPEDARRLLHAEGGKDPR